MGSVLSHATPHRGERGSWGVRAPWSLGQTRSRSRRPVLTLLGSIVLRIDLGKDALSEDGYGGILAAALFAAPSVELLYGFKSLFSWLCDKTDESPSAIPDVVGAGDLDGTCDQTNAVGQVAPSPKRP